METWQSIFSRINTSTDLAKLHVFLFVSGPKKNLTTGNKCEKKHEKCIGKSHNNCRTHKDKKKKISKDWL